MTYAVTIDVHAPAAAYQAMHAQLLERTGGQVDGLLVHLARPTADGFQVLEVWDTKASYDHFNNTVIAPLTTQAGVAPPAGTSADRRPADPGDVRHQDRRQRARHPSRPRGVLTAGSSWPARSAKQWIHLAQINQLWILSLLTGAELASVHIGGYFAAVGPTAVTLRPSARFRPVRGSALVPGRITSRCRSGSGTGRATALPGRSGDCGRIPSGSGQQLGGWRHACR